MATESWPLQPLSRGALTVRRIRVALRTAVGLVTVTSAVAVVRRFFDVPFPVWVLVAAVLGVSLLAWWWTGVDHARWGWRLTPDMFEVRRGVVVHRTHLVPRSRIQNVTTTAGPLQRRYGLVTLMVHTAGARTRNVAVEDIDVGHSAAIRRRLDLL